MNAQDVERATRAPRPDDVGNRDVRADGARGGETIMLLDDEAVIHRRALGALNEQYAPSELGPLSQ